ncbi:MAG: hypothetical protein AAFN80_10655, partial [Pseudomonadota bacterium]
MGDLNTTAALWWAVVASGIYHGINPGMGWPLAVSSALMEQKYASLYKALAALALGHLIAMATILFPFSMLRGLVDWQRAVLSDRMMIHRHWRRRLQKLQRRQLCRALFAVWLQSCEPS